MRCTGQNQTQISHIEGKKSTAESPLPPEPLISLFQCEYTPTLGQVYVNSNSQALLLESEGCGTMTHCWVKQVLFVSSSQAPSRHPGAYGGCPESVPEQGFQAREQDKVRGQDLAIWAPSLDTGDPSHFKIEKHLVLIHLSKTSSVSPRREKAKPTHLPGPRGSFQRQCLPLFNSCN